jgi:hypothetical protein
MGRCVYCHSVVTRDDDFCYICGDDLRGYNRVGAQAKALVRHKPVSALTNLVFLASLGFTAYCFFAEHKLSLPMTLAISSALLLLRILAERLVNKNLD